jgi:predicted aspartyl protease
MTDDKEPGWTKVNVRQPPEEMREYGPSLQVGIAATPYTGGNIVTALAQIDTGASGTAVSTRIANLLNLEPTGEGEVREAGREPVTGYYAKVRLFLPGTDIELDVVGLSSLHPPHEVLIGRDILSIAGFSLILNAALRVFISRLRNGFLGWLVLSVFDAICPNSPELVS